MVIAKKPLAVWLFFWLTFQSALGKLEGERFLAR